MNSNVELDPDECRRRLRENDLGCVAIVSGDHPVILPVNDVIHGDLIVVRTDSGKKLAEIPMRIVAFAIDGGGTSSVLVQGCPGRHRRTGRHVRRTS